jgi:hypothetical protein
MSIKNLTDDTEARFPRIGKLRKGGEKIFNERTQKWQFGEELPYWRFVSDNQAIVQAFKAAYGDQPRNLVVFVPYETPDQAFPTWCEVWSVNNTMVHRCDGENAFIWLEDGKYRRGSVKCPGGHTKDDPLNDAVGRLNIVIPELVHAGYVGYVTMETHGKLDLMSITSSLRKAYEARRDLRGIPFNLTRVLEEVSTPGFGERVGKRSKVKKWNVKLVPVPDWVQLQLEMAKAEQMKFLEVGEIIDVKPTVTKVLSEPQPPTTQAPGAAPVHQKPPTTPASEKPKESKNNEKKPPQKTGEELHQQFEKLGNALWPGQWTEGKNVRKLVGEAYNGDLDTMIVALIKKMKNITDAKVMQEHIAKTWPGLERTLPGVLQLAPYAKSLDILQGIANAAALKAKIPDATDADLVNWVLKNIPEAEEK